MQRSRSRDTDRKPAADDVARAREYPRLETGATMGTICEYEDDGWTWVIITDLPDKTWGDVFDTEDDRADELVVRLFELDKLSDAAFARFETCAGCREHVSVAREYSDHEGAGRYSRRSDFREKFRPLGPLHPDARDGGDE